MMERGVGRKEGTNFDLSAKDGGNDGISPSLARPSFYASQLSKFSFRDAGLGWAKQLLGPDAYLAFDNMVFKPPRVGGTTPWHQDEAYNNPLRYQRQVTIWIAMFDTTPENGAMAFIPGSHLLGVLPHRLNGGGSHANSLECFAGFDPSTAAVCSIPAGAMTIHHGCTIHGASVNKSDANRLGYIFNYKVPPVAHPELGEFSWNANVAASVHQQHRRWLKRGGILAEAVRFLRSDRDNQRYFIERFLKRVGL
jgi:ectoine hydroxylase-related dioxygenase (phytanoyl-CoA dioxygenase family)